MKGSPFCFVCSIPRSSNMRCIFHWAALSFHHYCVLLSRCLLYGHGTMQKVYTENNGLYFFISIGRTSSGKRNCVNYFFRRKPFRESITAAGYWFCLYSCRCCDGTVFCEPPFHWAISPVCKSERTTTIRQFLLRCSMRLWRILIL